MKPHQNGISIANNNARLKQQYFLAAIARQRFTALAKSAVTAERTAAEAQDRRKASWREYQRLSAEAGLARGRHYSLANDARRAAAEATAARSTLRCAVMDLYVTWSREHRTAPETEHERFLAEIADACAMPPRDLLRLIGQKPSTRTSAERDEDFERYRAGWSMRRIAKARGINVYAVQLDIHARLARYVEGLSCGLDRPLCNRCLVDQAAVAEGLIGAPRGGEQSGSPS
jgi:hypothetical protein